MTQEEKQLLLKDLCMRIPYRTFVCLNPGAYNKPETCILTGGTDDGRIHLNVDSDLFRIDHIKPYLRPMSSMTEEEENEYQDIVENDGNWVNLLSQNLMDFFYRYHFDYRGLIEKGLALEAPEGMYKNE